MSTYYLYLVFPTYIFLIQLTLLLLKETDLQGRSLEGK